MLRDENHVPELRINPVLDGIANYMAIPGWSLPPAGKIKNNNFIRSLTQEEKVGATVSVAEAGCGS